MICQKCHTPYNEGDKFCQGCGTTLETNNEPKNEEVAPVQPVATNEVTNPVADDMNQQGGQMVPPAQPMNQTPMNNMENMNNNLNNNMNGMNPAINMGNVQPMNNIPQEPKKNNTIVFILIGVIVVLIAVVIFLALNNNDAKDNDSKDDNKEVVEKDDDNDEPSKEVVSSSYNKTEVNGYTFYLPEGYNAGYYENIMFYDDDMYVQGFVTSGAGMISTIDKDRAKANFEQVGITNITYTTLNENGKELIVFTGNYNDYVVDVIYVGYTATKYVAAEVYYVTGTADAATKDDVYDIVSRIEVSDTAYSTTTNIRVPNLKLEIK